MPQKLVGFNFKQQLLPDSVYVGLENYDHFGEITNAKIMFCMSICISIFFVFDLFNFFFIYFG